MKDELILFILPECPYCKEALNIIEDLKSENEIYKEIEITLIDERKNSELASQYDYYYVPTFYFGKTKLHEGAATRDKVAAVFDKYLSE